MAVWGEISNTLFEMHIVMQPVRGVCWFWCAGHIALQPCRTCVLLRWELHVEIWIYKVFPISLTLFPPFYRMGASFCCAIECIFFPSPASVIPEVFQYFNKSSMHAVKHCFVGSVNNYCTYCDTMQKIATIQSSDNIDYIPLESAISHSVAGAIVWRLLTVSVASQKMRAVITTSWCIHLVFFLVAFLKTHRKTQTTRNIHGFRWQISWIFSTSINRMHISCIQLMVEAQKTRKACVRLNRIDLFMLWCYGLQQSDLVNMWM